MILFASIAAAYSCFPSSFPYRLTTRTIKRNPAAATKITASVAPGVKIKSEIKIKLTQINSVIRSIMDVRNDGKVFLI